MGFEFPDFFGGTDMNKIISVFLTMLIIMASVWVALPAVASETAAPAEPIPVELPIAPDTAITDDGLCAEHTFGEWSAETGATCTAHNYHTRICSVCKFVEVEKVSDKLGHAPAVSESPEAESPYTFDETTESHSFLCVNCNETVTEKCTMVCIESAPECAASAKNTYECSVCKAKVTRSEPTAHKIDAFTPVENSMQHKGTCTGCKEEVIEDCVFETVSETATCTDGGKRISQCVCGRTIDEASPALGHHVETWLHIEGMDIHAGFCTRCLASVNEICVVENYTADAIGEDGAIRHSGTCAVCLAPYTQECTKGEFAHVEGTATHQTACIGCARPFTEFCTPDETGLTSDGKGTHSGICTVCLSAFTEACTPDGAFTHNADTESHTATCTECEQPYVAACNIKTWTPTEKTDAESGKTDKDLHKGNCSDCGEEYVKSCTVESFTLDAAKGICSAPCTVCGDTVEHESDLGEWTLNTEDNTHSIVCAVCEATSSHPVTVAENGWKHNETESARGVHSHEGTCTVCNTTVSGACEFEKDAANKHKNTCKVCAYSYEDECETYIKDKENSTSPTCTEPGYIYYICEDCGKRDDSQTVTKKALGHKLVLDTEAEITSTADNHTAVYKCANEGCDYTETKTEKHEFADAKPAKNGTHTLTCKVCDREKTEKCTAKDIPAVEATCTEGGLTAGKECKECGAILVKQTATSALGHNYKYHSTTATCAKAGKDIFKCVCGETKEVAAAANGKHTWKENKRIAATATANGYVEYKCKDCAASYREILVYSVDTGTINMLLPIAVIVLLSGGLFLGVRRMRKNEAQK